MNETTSNKYQATHQVTRYGNLMQRTKRQRLQGDMGLMLAIVDQARDDFLFCRDEAEVACAARFFLGPHYKNILAWYELPATWLPEEITLTRLHSHAALAGFDKILGKQKCRECEGLKKHERRH